MSDAIRLWGVVETSKGPALVSGDFKVDLSFIVDKAEKQPRLNLVKFYGSDEEEWRARGVISKTFVHTTPSGALEDYRASLRRDIDSLRGRLEDKRLLLKQANTLKIDGPLS